MAGLWFFIRCVPEGLQKPGEQDSQGDESHGGDEQVSGPEFCHEGFDTVPGADPGDGSAGTDNTVKTLGLAGIEDLPGQKPELQDGNGNDNVNPDIQNRNHNTFQS